MTNVVFSAEFFFVYRSFYLSLNKRDPLGDGNDSLRDLGLVSGDLLHVQTQTITKVRDYFID